MITIIKIHLTVFLIIAAVFMLAWIATERETVSLFLRGVKYQNHGNPVAAIVCFDTCSMLSPRFYRTYYIAGLAYATLGRYDKALGQLKHCRELVGQSYGQDSLLMVIYRDSIRAANKPLSKSQWIPLKMGKAKGYLYYDLDKNWQKEQKTYKTIYPDEAHRIN
jgi:tetratricopeptide (TPR) repeat protein